MKKSEKKQLVEIARSFSYKMGLPEYSSVDFFCSQKTEAPVEDRDKASEDLYVFCKKEVERAVNEYKEQRFGEVLKKKGLEVPKEPVKDTDDVNAELDATRINEARSRVDSLGIQSNQERHTVV